MNKEPKQAINIAIWLIAANFAEIGIRKWTKEMIAALTGEEIPEETEDQAFIKNLGKVLNNIPFVGSIFSAMQYGEFPIPSLSMAAKVGEAIYRAAKTQGDEDKEAEQKVKAWMKFISTAIPGGQQIDALFKEEK